ncbi:MAG: M48 family metalloprotease [Synechococcales bacterium]|nr:M48 family metalloprotease [Synechococcales bacterium]
MSGPSTHPPNDSLAAGLAALEQQDYAVAIAHLEVAAQNAPTPLTRFKAQAALIRAYERSGNIQQAIFSTQLLLRSSDASVRDWATDTLEELNTQYVQIPASDSLTPSPTVTSPATARADEHFSDSTDPTGFVPLNASPLHSHPSTHPPATPPAPAAEPAPNPFVFPEEIAAEAIAPNDPAAAISPDAIAPVARLPKPTTRPPAHSAAPQPKPRSRKSSQRPSHSPQAYPPVTAKVLPPRPIPWRQADRAQRWGSLPPVRQPEFWLSQVWTAIALTLVSSALLQTAMAFGNPVRRFLSRFIRVYRWTFLETHPTWVVLIGLVGVLCVSPWVLDFILGRFYGRRPMTLDDLAAHSPEASRLLKRICQQQSCPLPKLGLIADSAPLLLGYGIVPRTVRLVVSQGLLQQLSDDEIAALYATRWAAAKSWGMAPLSLVTLVAQIPYQVYWQVATWGDRLGQPFGQAVLGAIAALTYGIYWLLHGTGLWLARTVAGQGDRAAAGLTGNPNGLIRALLKITVGMAHELKRQGKTSPLWESFDLLMPVDHRTALTLGSVYSHSLASEESVDVDADPWGQSPALTTGIFNWGRLNPHRRWLTVNQPHPPLGDRLYTLTQIAQQWRLDSELSWKAPPPPTATPSPIWLQAAPFVAIPIGLMVAGFLWLVGGIAGLMGFQPLTWLWGDRSILWGCLAIGASFGILIRLNSFFIDIKSSNLQINPDLPDLLRNTAPLPVDGHPVQMEGKLMGRQGVSNWLNQDWYLDSPTGLVKLHIVSPLGPFGSIATGGGRPHAFLGRPVVVTGWFRSGATPWLDVSTLRTRGGRALQSHHSTWSSVIAIALAVWGAVVIYRGSF